MTMIANTEATECCKSIVINRMAIVIWKIHKIEIRSADKGTALHTVSMKNPGHIIFVR